MPLLDVLWAMLWFFLFIAWIWLLFTLITDIFRSRDLGGWGKALWILFIVFLPLLGSLVYLIARGGSMAERSIQAAQEQERRNREYIRSVSSNGSSTADEIDKLAQLRAAGTLTEDEFQAQKAKLLAQA
jgi:putative oligomerization/nucleic acid binding protein/phospholipase D-like protein